jgi:5-methylthioadenosine/S-adenosylhomocysteine deaminase
MADYCPGESGVDFVPWLQGLTDRWRQISGSGCYAQTIFHRAAVSGIEAMVEAGTTHVTDISATGASIDPLLSSGLEGVVYIEVVGMYAEQADRALNGARYLIDEYRPRERSGMRLGLTLHTAYTVHPALWKKGLEYARKEALPLCIHAAESHDEFDYLKYGKGLLADQREMMGVTFPIPHKTPIQFLDDIGALELKPLLIHAVEVDDDDLLRIKKSGGSVVHCPRSNARLHCRRMPLEKYLAHNIPVYIGTDSLASAPTLNVLDDVEFAVKLHDGKVGRKTIERLARQPLAI